MLILSQIQLALCLHKGYGHITQQKQAQEKRKKEKGMGISTVKFLQ